MSTQPKPIPGGLIIVFDGIDGVGKTTQLQQTAASLRAAGWLVYTTRIHGGTPIGEQIRSVSLAKLTRPVETDLYLALAAQAALVVELASKRQEGYICLIDRSPMSIVGYQIYGDKLDPDLGWSEVDASMGRFAAELSIIYTASVTVALKRAQQKIEGNDDYFGSRSEAYFAAVQSGYREAATRYGAKIIDSEQGLEQVHAATMQLINEVISKQIVDASTPASPGPEHS